MGGQSARGGKRKPDERGSPHDGSTGFHLPRVVAPHLSGTGT